ncbi:MAG TPA: hypothetical protein VL988_06960 [Solirubrobacteraceae bacterium]|nr:hypothetical protein [Solirubrobacteraceae bacterium]
MSEVALDVSQETPIQTFYDGPLFDPLGMRAGLSPVHGVPSHGLPPGEVDLSAIALEQRELRFAIDPGSSFFGDCIKVVDEPDEDPLAAGFPPFGWSGPQLLDGHALTASRLHGELSIVFGHTQQGRLPFTISYPPLRGDDAVLATPRGWELPAVGNEVRPVKAQSRGVLEISTGRVYDFHFNAEFWNSAIAALLEQNPGLAAPPLLFPGTPHAGHALAWFGLLEDGTPTFGMGAQMFLPLGPGDPLTMPGSASADGPQAPFRACNSSLHPFIHLSCQHERAAGSPNVVHRSASARTPIATLLGDRQNSTILLKCLPRETFFGDDFDVRGDDLGGPARAQSPLFGQIELQLGRITGGSLPFVLQFARPSVAFEPKFEALMQLLPPGTRAGLVGMRGDLVFPEHTYEQRNLSLNSDPYKLSIGVADVATGAISSCVLRKYLFQDLMLALLQLEPRTPTDSFAYLCTGRFGTERDRLTLDLEGALHIPYPVGYKFPLPGGRATQARKGSQLTPFLQIRALEQEAFSAADAGEEFIARHHVRGVAADRLELRLARDERHAERTVAELRLDDVVLSATGPRPQHARVGDTTLTTGELVVDGENRACSYYLTRCGSEVDLQIVSSDEELDLWHTGIVNGQSRTDHKGERQ